MIFHENRLLVIPYFFSQKLERMSQNLFSAAVVIDALSVKSYIIFDCLPLIHSRRVVVSYKRKYVHELLVNRLFKPAQEKVWLGELTVPQ